MEFLYSNRFRMYDGLDSVQGYLELAEVYNQMSSRFVCNTRDESDQSSMYFRIKKLEQEGHLVATFEPFDGGETTQKTLTQLSLTTSGHKLLNDLKQSSLIGKIRKRTFELLWVVVTTVITTLVVLEVKGL